METNVQREIRKTTMQQHPQERTMVMALAAAVMVPVAADQVAATTAPVATDQTVITEIEITQTTMTTPQLQNQVHQQQRETP